MNVWPLHSSRRAGLRRTRGTAAFVALMLVASNALATMGLCIVKAPAAAAPIAAVAEIDEAPCAGHAAVQAADELAQPRSVVAAHCTQDDPGVQARAGDVPPAAFDAVPVFQRAVPCLAARSIASDRHDASPPEPLYARLSRLLL